MVFLQNYRCETYQRCLPVIMHHYAYFSYYNRHKNCRLFCKNAVLYQLSCLRCVAMTTREAEVYAKRRLRNCSHCLICQTTCIVYSAIFIKHIVQNIKYAKAAKSPLRLVCVDTFFLMRQFFQSYGRHPKTQVFIPKNSSIFVSRQVSNMKQLC